MKKSMKLLLKKRDQQGFTLIELLVVVAIIGVLMAVGVSSYLGYRTTGANSAAQAAASDYLTLALADVAANGGPQTFGFTEATKPQGFDLPDASQIATTGTLTIADDGTITNAVTFRGSNGGDVTYTVDADGVTGA